MVAFTEDTSLLSVDIDGVVVAVVGAPQTFCQE